ncbi:PqiC family protein [Advenella sp. RU8]|uniref:PqiC family protein n=1 Tax=Advenella sp. RU8 TaxID=3399575 RepID=UPI003AAB5C1F
MQQHLVILKRIAFFLGGGAVFALIAGCASAPPVKYYSLQPQTQSATVMGNAAIGLQIASPQIPESVDRPQLMVRNPAEPQVIYALNASRWASSLSDEIAQSLSFYLAGQLGAINVQNLPVVTGSLPVWTVQTNVQQFDLLPGNSAILDVVWTLKSPSRTIASWICQTRISVPVSQNDAVSVVDGQQQAIRLLANEMAKKINPGVMAADNAAQALVQTRACRQS